MARAGLLAKEEFDNSMRLDNTKKGSGFLGRLFMRDGSGKEATELSTSFTFDGEEVFMPTIVPTLTDSEIEAILSGKISPEMQENIDNKVIDHAFLRRKQNKSPFFNDGIDDRKDFPERKRFQMQKSTQIPRKSLLGNDIRL